MKEIRNNTYKTILKSTFLFGFVQAINIVAKVGISKAVAVFLGTEGMGVIGLLQSTINVLSTACGLGLSQSAVKDISQGANTSAEHFSKSISLTKKLILFTSTLGLVVTISMSHWLSEWTFGNDKYKYIYMALSVVVFLQIITEGQLAILKGARLLRFLAKASLFGSLVGLCTSVPLYFWLGEQGIAPSLIVAALTATFFSWHYTRKVNYSDNLYTIRKALKEGQLMIKMGVALMYVTFLGVVTDYLIRTFISITSSIEMVGLFQAGAMIVTAYFGIVITALTTDYYPRISAVNQDNNALQQEFNKQSEVGLLLIGTLVVIFMFAMPIFIKILYTDKFMPVIPFLQYAIFGVLFTVCSNALGMILLAKQASGIFFYTATIGRVVIVTVSLLFFYNWGLTGLGIAFAIAGVFHLAFMSVVMWRKYGIGMSKGLYRMQVVILCFAVCAFFIKELDSLVLRYSVGTLLFVLYLIYAAFQVKKTMNINIISLIKQRIEK